MKTDQEGSKNGEHYSELPENPSPSKILKKEFRKKESRILRRSKTLKDNNDPDRFCGEGINFKAKIIGTEHVFDARGNRMCQGALQRLKAAVKTSGDHKQRIILNISYNGITIKDEKTGEVLHHHPIHKISFISQDTVDKRSFGYVFGCPQTGHEFFGIKTEKIASHVVLTLRDLFLAALEMKKKEIESAKESQKDTEQPPKVTANGNPKPPERDAVNGASSLLRDELLYSNRVLLPDENAPPEEAAHGTLLDLQFSVDNLQMGISHMDHSIATAASQGFSFSEDDISESPSLPLHFKMDKFNPLCQETLSVSSRSSSTSDYNAFSTSEGKIMEEEVDAPPPSYVQSAEMPPPPCPKRSPSLGPSPHDAPVVSAAPGETTQDRYAVFQDIDALPSIFDDPTIVSASPSLKEETVSCEIVFENDSKESPEKCEIKASAPVAFAGLDPLGDHPFIDKRDFFQDIKNPPKKVLKDLVGGEEISSVSADVNNCTENVQTTSSADLFQSSSREYSAEEVLLSGKFRDFTSTPEKVLKDLVGLSTVSAPVNRSAENNLNSSRNSDDLFPSKDDFIEEVPVIASLNLSDHKQANPFAGSSVTSQAPPKLPPKRAMTVAASSDFSLSREDPCWEVKNPFNPFMDDDFPDVPPPSSPPPPPPRLPSKEAPPVTSPPPPRPPSRSNGIPTPPLPKRKMQLSGNTWFSFDQEALSFPLAHSASGGDDVPPLPSPARKFPSCVVESPSASSCSPRGSSTALTNPQLNESDVRQNSSVHRSSVAHEESNGFAKLFPETHESSKEALDSPPLPPKPLSIARPRPSPSKKMLSSVNSSSLSGSTVESSNGARSSSSLAFSSADDGKRGSSAEAFFNSSGDAADVFFQNERSSTSGKEVSPDSIFRRKSDPFADDFFLSLSRKPSDRQNSVDLHFESLEAST